MNIELNQSNFEALHQRTAKLELQLRLVNLFWIVIFGVLITSAWTTNKYSGEVIDNLRVRQITVLDEQGRERMSIGSPVPGPMTKGKRSPRSSPSTGIIINDAAGDERSGWGVLDNGRSNLCFDGTSGAEVVCLTQGGEDHGGLTIKDKNSNWLMFLGRLGYEERGVKLFLNDFKGRPRIKLQLEENENAAPKLELLNKNGDSIFTAAEPKTAAETKTVK
jgi:hypothetical protein